MKFVTKTSLLLGIFIVSVAGAQASEFYEGLLRKAAIDNGYKLPNETNRQFDKEKSKIGKKLFESTKLSFNGDTSCSSCHLDEHSSGDGIPNAIGVGGIGKGFHRVMSDGALVPRNTLPLWGRSNQGFEAFFWDGKVQVDGEKIISQFGSEPPSNDALEVAVHLPFVEIREMIVDNAEVNQHLKTESINSALEIQIQLLENLKADSLGQELAEAHDVPVNSLNFQHVTKSIVNFFADKFRLQETKFSEFMSGKSTLNESELRGGIIFYGKGQCSSCHSGPHFSDFSFHNIIFPQAGPGKNGFGIDYGRFNVTFNDSDLYKFRTPPLHNVSKTSPFGHSGSTYKLEEAIIAHYDPLSNVNIKELDDYRRRDLFARMISIDSDQPLPSALNHKEVQQLVAFLKTLNFK